VFFSVIGLIILLAVSGCTSNTQTYIPPTVTKPTAEPTSVATVAQKVATIAQKSPDLQGHWEGTYAWDMRDDSGMDLDRGNGKITLDLKHQSPQATFDEREYSNWNAWSIDAAIDGWQHGYRKDNKVLYTSAFGGKGEGTARFVDLKNRIAVIGLDFKSNLECYPDYGGNCGYFNYWFRGPLNGNTLNLRMGYKKDFTDESWVDDGPSLTLTRTT